MSWRGSYFGSYFGSLFGGAGPVVPNSSSGVLVAKGTLTGALTMRTDLALTGSLVKVTP